MAKYIAKTQMKNEAGELFDIGDVVELGSELAKKFRANGLLETYVPEDEPSPLDIPPEPVLPETQVEPPAPAEPLAPGDEAALTAEEQALLASALKSTTKK